MHKRKFRKLRHRRGSPIYSNRGNVDSTIDSGPNLIKTRVSAAHRSHFSLSSQEAHLFSVPRGACISAEREEARNNLWRRRWNVSKSNFSVPLVTGGLTNLRSFRSAEWRAGEWGKRIPSGGTETMMPITGRRRKTYSRRPVVCVCWLPWHVFALLSASFCRASGILIGSTDHDTRITFNASTPLALHPRVPSPLSFSPANAAISPPMVCTFHPSRSHYAFYWTFITSTRKVIAKLLWSSTRPNACYVTETVESMWLWSTGGWT